MKYTSISGVGGMSSHLALSYMDFQINMLQAEPLDTKVVEKGYNKQ